MDRKQILIVDDEPNVLMTYRLVLGKQNCDVTAVLSSGVARQTIDSLDFDLLMCDLSLERQVSGITVIEYALSRRSDLPTILLTGYASDEAIEWAESRHIPILEKPIDIQKLLELVHKLTARGDSSAAGKSKS